MKTLIFCFSLLLSTITHSQPWEKHGYLKVSENGHFLVYEDSTLFYWNGDTPWSLLTLDESEVEEYLSDRASRNFNVIQVMATRTRNKPEYGFMTQPGLKDIYYQMTWNGQIPLTSIEPITLNEAYWKHMDFIIDKAAEYGIYIAPVVMWGDNANKIFNNPEKDNFDYAYLLAERYKDKPNVIWIAAGEFWTISEDWGQPLNNEQKSLFQAIGKGLDKGANEKQLITIHGHGEWVGMPSTYFHNDEWCDFYMNQSWDRFQFIDSMMVHDWNLENPKPTILAEAKYEGSYYPTYTKNMALGDYCSDWHVRLQAYWSVFSGGIGHTYGAEGLWNSDGRLVEHILNYPGADDMQHLRVLFEFKPSLTRIYDNSFIKTDITNGRYELNVVLGTWDASKAWAFVYTSKGTKFEIDLSRFNAKKLSAKWFDPRLGIYKYIGEYDATAMQEFDPTNKKMINVHKGADWVLVLEAVK